MFYLSGVIITFFLVLLLLVKQNKTIADIILFFWLLVIGIHLSMFYMFLSNTYYKYPFLLGLNIPFPLFHGPLLYLYTAALTNQLKEWKLNLLHFLPIIIFYILLFDFFNLTEKEKISIFINNGKDYETLLNIILISVYCSGIIYVGLSLLLLEKHKKNILNQFSYIGKINMSWLRYLIYGLAFTWFFVFLGNDELIFGVVVLFVVFIGYFGINQAGLFTKSDLIKLDIKTEVNHDLGKIRLNEDKKQIMIKYEKSGLSEQTANEIHKLLKLKMGEEELFTDSELTLVELSQRLNVHPNNLSQVINTFEEKNFYDYINILRIEKFKTLIRDTENRKFTILSLAYDCGFNSKTSFNRYFKKVTKLTPSEYINSLNNKK